MARLILRSLKGWSLAELMANENRPASDYVINRSQEVVSQLLEDVPVQYALGEAEFYGLKLKVGPGVLIPRQETEELVDLIVRENPQPDLRVLDLCTGSGAIAVALARNLPFSEVEGVDVSPKALDYARENVESLKARNVKLMQADVFKTDFPEESFDIIVSNPPYVDESEKSEMEANVLDHEPHEALFVSDEDALVFYRRIAAIAAAALAHGGHLYFEINPRHAADLRLMLEKAGFDEVRIIADSHGRERMAAAVKR